MRDVHEVIIADASCLILLANVEHLHLLNEVYGNVVTTPEVAEEFGDPLPAWIDVRAVIDESRMEALIPRLDRGEASAIALAVETAGCLLILDDRKARLVARELDLDHTGTLGVVIKAKKIGVIASVQPLILALRAAGMWISDEVLEEAVREAGGV